MIKKLSTFGISLGLLLNLARAEESATQHIKDAAHQTREAVKEGWHKAKPKIKAAAKDIGHGAKDVGHATADAAKKVVKDFKSAK